MRTSLDQAVAPRIPFNKPYMTGQELEYVSRAIQSGRIAGDGPFTLRCAALLEERFRIRKVLMTPSCTAALEMAAMLCGLGPGDEVIMPSFTFVSTANAVVRLGARPVFVEIRPDTLTLDPASVEEAVTPRTRAIIPVVYSGVAPDMDRILRIAHEHGLRVIEDAAQGVNAFYKGRALGSIGDLGTYSFHDTKNLVCGEGGALCVNDPELIERAEIIRDKGTNRAQFFRGEVDKYTWIECGSSYIPSEIACAVLCAQIEAMDEIKDRRHAVYQFYRHRLRPLEREGLCRLPVIPDWSESHYQSSYLILDNGVVRDALMAFLKRHGVSAVFHFVPLHSSPMGKGLGYQKEDLAVTEEISERLLRLPSSCDISESEQSRVVDLVTAFLRRTPLPGAVSNYLPRTGAARERARST